MVMDEQSQTWAAKRMEFNKTELGALFTNFVRLHARAWQLDERSAVGYGVKASDRAWKDLEPVEKELVKKLMQIAGVLEVEPTKEST